MATFLRCLFLSLTLSLWSNSVTAQNNYCYWTGTGYNSTCWACQPNGGFPDWWRQTYCGAAAPTCQQRVETQTLQCQSGYTGSITQSRNIMCANPYQEVVNEWYTTSNTCTPICTVQTQQQTQSCPANYSGQILQQRQTVCPSGSWGAWQTISNTCTPNPPTCQISSQTQTLSCETGYTGSITQTRSLTCPDPYGSPVIGAWTTTTNTCVKSVTNPTNVTSPISPISPVNPTSVVSQAAVVTPTQTTQTSSISAPTIPSSPVTVETQPAAQNSETTQTTSQTSTVTSSAPTVVSSAPPPVAPTGAKVTSQPPKGKLPLSSVPLALSLDLITKPQIVQPNLFPGQDISLPLPLHIIMNDKTMMDLLGVQLQPQTNKFNDMLKFTVEYDQ